MTAVTQKSNAPKLERVNLSLASGDLKQIGKDFLLDLRDLTVNMLKPALNALLKGVGYTVSRSIEPEKFAQDLNRIKEASAQGLDNLKKSAVRTFASLRGGIKQAYSNLRAQNIDRVQNKRLAKALRKAELIKDPAIKAYVSGRIASVQKGLAASAAELLKDYRDVPLHLKPASPIADIKSMNSSALKSLSRLAEATGKIDEIPNVNVRNDIMKAYKEASDSCRKTLKDAFSQQPLTSKGLVEFYDIRFRAERFLAKAVKNAITLHKHASSKGLENPQSKSVQLIDSFSASLNEKIIDGQLSDKDILGLTREIKGQINQQARSSKVLKGLLDQLKDLTPEDLDVLKNAT